MKTLQNRVGLAVFLVSDAAASVNGSTSTVDGGLARSYHER
jgi:enoyl-[acyl-carrier-protein] reductase (NADH)